METDTILAGLPLPTISTSLLWEALIDIAPREDIGQGPHGHRVIVPITGGSFRGGPEHPDLSGSVLAGGADRQLHRTDGGRELDALYEMRIADGTLLTIRNRVIIDDAAPEGRYALSRVQVTAPTGVWDWLNRRVIIGTLQPAMPKRQAVVIRAFLARTGI
ncbi:DUF3237 domain-containing protein [Oceanicola sp. 22II-s10i]|uniref:DUF3237 domain-containing protein n=1 Tax=Oceanicola sp. 22II-s10i TaxID=1317116 RepID=UPI001595F06B|nr:DUF3237 domain-containing protein [Oceanicola sp. 22II-s10i]